MSKIRFFGDSNLESESGQRFESEPEPESHFQGYISTGNQYQQITWTQKFQIGLEEKDTITGPLN